MNEQLSQLLKLPDNPRYNIKAVVQQTQVNVSTLRAWETRYGVPRPNRSDSGHRLYSQRDIAIIQWLKQATEEGLAISQAVAVLQDVGSAPPPPVPVPALGVSINDFDHGWSDLRRQLIDALVATNLRQAHLIVNTAVSLFPTETVVIELFAPVLVEVGERWANSQICVAEEHLISNFMRQRLLAMMQLHAPFAQGPRVICACMQGEHHEIGLLMFALLMEQRGWEVLYIGQDLPTDGLLDFAARIGPAMLCFSATMVEHLTGLVDITRLIAALRERQVLVAFGGRVFERYPEAIERAGGTYLGANLRECVERADSLGELVDPQRWASNHPARPVFVSGRPNH